MFYSLSPSKPHKNRAQIHAKSTSKSQKSVRPNLAKMRENHEEKRGERERGYLLECRRLTGKREEEGRWSEWERERDESFGLRGRKPKKKKKERGAGCCWTSAKTASFWPAKTTSFWLVRKTNSVDTNDRSFGCTKRHVVSHLFERQVVCYIRTTRRLIIRTNDSTRNARRHAVCSKTLNDRAFKPNDTPFSSGPERLVVYFLIYFFPIFFSFSIPTNFHSIQLPNTLQKFY